MNTLENLITAPLAISAIVGARAVLNGRSVSEETATSVPSLAETVSVQPILLLGLLAAMLLTGTMLIVMEMRAEARDRKG